MGRPLWWTRKTSEQVREAPSNTVAEGTSDGRDETTDFVIYTYFIYILGPSNTREPPLD